MHLKFIRVEFLLDLRPFFKYMHEVDITSYILLEKNCHLNKGGTVIYFSWGTADLYVVTMFFCLEILKE